MPYPQDLVGRFVAYRIDPGGTMNLGMQGQLVNGLLPGQTTAAAVAVYTGTPFNNTNAPWNFTFLKYYAGAVTTAPLGGGPVMTGPMTGCYLCKYTQGGAQGLAHIGTANAVDSAESIAVKTAWKTFVARNDVSQVTGGTPFDYFTTGEFRAAMLSPSAIPSVVGYFDGGASYAMLLAPVPQNMNPPVPMLKVAGLKSMTLQPWATIAGLRTFRM